MSTLFPVEYPYPQGFTYQPDFLSPVEELTLIAAIKQTELHNLIFQGFLAKRRTASFGYDYNFDRRTISKGPPVPLDFIPLIQKVAHHLSIGADQFAELLVTEYPVGSVINWHRDAPPFNIIVGISLHAGCNFRLRPHEKAKQSRSAIISFPVARRSLYVIKDEARTAWQHSIAPVKETRYSLTLRTLIKNT